MLTDTVPTVRPLIWTWPEVVTVTCVATVPEEAVSSTKVVLTLVVEPTGVPEVLNCTSQGLTVKVVPTGMVEMVDVVTENLHEPKPKVPSAVPDPAVTLKVGLAAVPLKSTDVLPVVPKAEMPDVNVKV